MLEINSRLMEDILKGKSYVDKKHFEEDRLSIKSGSSTGSLNLGSRSITKSCLVSKCTLWNQLLQSLIYGLTYFVRFSEAC